MDLMQAIATRISCRSFADKPLENEKFTELAAYIDELNEASGLHFQLYGPREDSGTAIDMSTKMFAGPVYCYAALVALEDPISAEKVGYFGEKLVLRATQMGLGTCWVASTYDASTTRAELAESERLWDVVPIGYATDKVPMKQRMIRASIRRSDKSPKQLTSSDTPFSQLPEWFTAAIDAVIAGPSAINEQPVVFTYANGTVKTSLPNQKRALEFNDLGIAKLHFEIAAAAHGMPGTWEWGAEGAFVPTA